MSPEVAQCRHYDPEHNTCWRTTDKYSEYPAECIGYSDCDLYDEVDEQDEAED